MPRQRGRDPTSDLVTGYRVRRSDRARRARLTVTDEGEAVVVLPRRASLRDAAALVQRHAAWLERHVARARAEQAALEQRVPLGQGRVLQVAGRSMRVHAVDAGGRRPGRGRVEVAGDAAGGSAAIVVHLGRDGRGTASLLDAWLRERARAALSEQVGQRRHDLAVEPGRISIRDQRSRWASASARGDLSFSWRLVLTPPFVLDAVVVHELAHLRLRGHGAAFWSLVERHAPRTREARRWLRDHAREVRAALD